MEYKRDAKYFNANNRTSIYDELEAFIHQTDVYRSPVCKTTSVEQSLKPFIEDFYSCDENVCAAVKEELNEGDKK